MSEVKQLGPPFRIGAYQLSVTDEKDGVFARAILVDNEDGNLPREILSTSNGLAINAGNVAGEYRVMVPPAVLRALMKMTGWKVELPDSLNPNILSAVGTCPHCNCDIVLQKKEGSRLQYQHVCSECHVVTWDGTF